MSPVALRITQLAAALGGADAFIVPSNDEFQGEYTPGYAKRLEWLTGFTGSAGALVVLAKPHDGKPAAFFTDGRYTIQAREQVGDGVHHFNSGDKPPMQWLADSLPGGTIAYDPWLHTRAQLRSWRKLLPDGATLKPAANPVDALWQDRPQPPKGAVIAHPMEWAGQSSQEKIAGIVKELKAKKAQGALLALPDGINWLLNIRGSDIPYNPLLLCFALVDDSGKVTLFTHGREPVDIPVDKSVDIACITTLTTDPKSLFENYKSLMIDPASCAEWFFAQAEAAGCTIVEAADPTLLPKARKNTAEQDGIRTAHRRDGVALTKFLQWLDGALASRDDVNELEVEAKLDAFRAESNLYRGPSFATIAGAGGHGAIVHYRATEASNRNVADGELLLIDSGGQYPDGTTDVTRTVVRGTPKPEMKDRFTRVLKGHIALAMAIFPQGTTGAQLDALARQFLWEAGLDYDHGTGHGVGAFLCVHEGPQRISKRGGDVALEAGMILSNEPGYYKTGEYGIRIENLVMVVEAAPQGAEKTFFAFETLTLAPIDERLVDWDIMSDAETRWLREYQAKVAANRG